MPGIAAKPDIRFNSETYEVFYLNKKAKYLLLCIMFNQQDLSDWF
jgi:hypothetical protein